MKPIRRLSIGLTLQKLLNEFKTQSSIQSKQTHKHLYYQKHANFDNAYAQTCDIYTDG